jgi:hypothetical protein
VTSGGPHRRSSCQPIVPGCAASVAGAGTGTCPGRGARTPRPHERRPHRPARMRPKNTRPAHHPLPLPTTRHIEALLALKSARRRATRTVGDRRRNARHTARLARAPSGPAPGSLKWGDKVARCPGASTRSSARSSRSTAPRRNTGNARVRVPIHSPAGENAAGGNISFPEDSLRLVAAA